MNDWEGEYTSGGGLHKSISPLPRRKFSLGAQVSVLGVVVLAVGLFAAVLGSQQSQDNRSRASGYNTTYSMSYPTPTPSSYSSNFCFFFFGCSNTSPTPTVIPTTGPTTPVATVTSASTPTPTGILPTATTVPVATAIPTVTWTVTPTGFPTPTPTGILPTATTVPVATIDPTGTSLALTLNLNGIGDTGNSSPLHPQRSVTVEVYNVQNQLVVSRQAIINYQESSGKFTGTVNLNINVATGAYSVKVKADQYLRNLLPGIQTITQNQVNVMPEVTLMAGDVSGDNTINIVDYSILMDCFSDLLPATDCSETNKVLADLTDDGHVNQFDYNFFLRELSSKSGQ